MKNASRRMFLKSGAICGLASWLGGRPAGAVSASGGETPAAQDRATPLIHVTDLFHPHGDPDDHFDLACVYALALRRRLDLRGVVIDYPPSFRAGDPAVVAVAQTNHISGLAVPISIGTSRKLASRTDALPDAPRRDTAAVRFLIEQLRASDGPIALACVGSAADIVVAALREPALFRDKCSGVYLNSGSAHDNPAKPAQLEFNVRLDLAFARGDARPALPAVLVPCWNVTKSASPAGRAVSTGCRTGRRWRRYPIRQPTFSPTCSASPRSPNGFARCPPRRPPNPGRRFSRRRGGCGRRPACWRRPAWPLRAMETSCQPARRTMRPYSA